MKRILWMFVALVLICTLAASCAAKDEGLDLNLQNEGGFVADAPQDDSLEESEQSPSQSPDAVQPEEQENQTGTHPHSAGTPEQNGDQTEEPDTKDPAGEEQEKPTVDSEKDEPAKNEPPKEEQEQPKEYPWITVCSYNVKLLYYDHINNANGAPLSKLNAVCNELRKIKADVVGLQELDRFSEAAGGTDKDQLKLLADALGYPYYYYTKTTSTMGGISEYGHGVLSKYPIKSSENFPFYQFYVDSTTEPRAFSRHVLEIEGKELVVYNTHLAEKIVDQFDVITKMMAEDKANGRYAVLTGDMNIAPANLSANTNGCIMLNTVENPIRTSYPDGWMFPPCDNIVVTDNLEYSWDAAKKTGITVVQTSASDHLPIYTKIRMKD